MTNAFEPANTPPKRSRFSVTFDSRSTERLERMAQDDEGKAEVIRQALALEDLYRQTISSGGKVLIQRKNGTVAEVIRP